MKGSAQVLAIYRNYKEDDTFTKRIEYFVQYKFLPGLGFLWFWFKSYDWWFNKKQQLML
jgi:hypothetical protein